MYLIYTDTRRCLPRHAASAEGEGVGDTLYPMQLHDGWPDCVQIWCVFRDQLAIIFIQVRGGVHPHVRTWTPLSHTLQTAGGDCVQIWFVAGNPLDKRFTQVRGDVQLHVRTYYLYYTDGRST